MCTSAGALRQGGLVVSTEPGIPLRGDAVPGYCWISPNKRVLVVLSEDEEDYSFLNLIDTASGSPISVTSVDYHPDGRLDLIQVCWAGDSSRLAVLTDVDSGTELIEMRAPNFEALPRVEIRRPPSDHSTPYPVGVRFNASGTRLAIDYTSIFWPPDGWPYGVVIYDFELGREVLVLEWNLFVGAIPVLNSEMTIVCLGVNTQAIDSDDESDSWSLLMVEVDSGAEEFVSLETTAATIDADLGEFERLHVWDCAFGEEEQTVLVQPREGGTVYEVSIDDRCVLRSLEAGVMPEEENPWSYPASIEPNYTGLLTLDAMRALARGLEPESTATIPQQNNIAGEKRRVALELPNEGGV